MSTVPGEQTYRGWLDSTATLIVRASEPGLYRVGADGSYRFLGTETESERELATSLAEHLGFLCNRACYGFHASSPGEPCVHCARPLNEHEARVALRAYDAAMREASR
jgi:hypothetical protein